MFTFKAHNCPGEKIDGVGSEIPFQANLNSSCRPWMKLPKQLTVDKVYNWRWHHSANVLALPSTRHQVLSYFRLSTLILIWFKITGVLRCDTAAFSVAFSGFWERNLLFLSTESSSVRAATLLEAHQVCWFPVATDMDIHICPLIRFSPSTDYWHWISIAEVPNPLNNPNDRYLCVL